MKHWFYYRDQKKNFIEKRNIENIIMISNYFEKCANFMFLH